MFLNEGDLSDRVLLLPGQKKFAPDCNRGSRKISATTPPPPHWIWPAYGGPEKFLLLPPPPHWIWPAYGDPEKFLLLPPPPHWIWPACGDHGKVAPPKQKSWLRRWQWSVAWQEDANETEGKCSQNCGQTSSVVWCGDLGNNERTISMTRSKWDEDAEMDVRKDRPISEMNTLEGQQEWCKRQWKLQKTYWSCSVCVFVIVRITVCVPYK